ncbi:hypothetical protein J4438_02510 [Candidatus Woesearchaeota archaeon]|nr:hypothetical protein [Candidatus Woesearchaeota archaeon]
MFNFLKKYKEKKEMKEKVERTSKLNKIKEFFEVGKKPRGKFEDFISDFRDHSLIMLIIGKRGSGKTALGMRFIEIANMFKKKIYIMGFDNSKTPTWMKKTTSIEEIPNDSVVLVDEAGISFSARSSMKKANKELSSLLSIARHKNLSLIFITQSSAMLDVNVLRLADILLFKEPSLLQSKFERKGLQDMFNKVGKSFDKLEGKKEYFYIISDDFEGLVKTSLPSFWNESISKSFSKK